MFRCAMLATMTVVLGLLVSTSCAEEERVVALLRELSEAAGPPGLEEPVRKIMVERMRPFADKITYDGIGSVIAVRGKSGPRVMVDAHMDEVGGMVRRITPDGFLSMQLLGGWLDQALVDQRWTIVGSKGPVLAVTGIRDAHVAQRAERSQVFSRNELYLDVGASSAEQVRKMGIGPGDPVVPDAPFAVLNGTQNYLGKAWDDRVGCAVILEVMRRLAEADHPNQIYYAATVQEEVGLRGAGTAAALIKPDIAIALESGITRDVPGVSPELAQEDLGGGPGLFLYNSSQLPNRKFVRFVREAAAEKSIPLQLELVVGYGDDSGAILQSNGGVPTVCLVVPTRYTHAHNSIINRRDFDQLVELLAALLEKLDADTVAEIRDFTPRE